MEWAREGCLLSRYLTDPYSYSIALLLVRYPRLASIVPSLGFHSVGTVGPSIDIDDHASSFHPGLSSVPVTLVAEPCSPCQAPSLSSRNTAVGAIGIADFCR